MDIAMIGLGRMGGNMARRLLRGRHRVVMFDRAAGVGEGIKADEPGGEVAASYQEVVAKLKPPRHVWLMLPAGEITGQALVDFMSLLSPGDTLIDGGSGGVWGLANGDYAAKVLAAMRNQFGGHAVKKARD